MGANGQTVDRQELLRRKADRAEEAKKKREAHELLCLQLEERFCTELGPVGEVWQIVNTDNACGIGPICVKRPDPAAHKLFQSRLRKDDYSTEDEVSYVRGAILYPDMTTWNPISGEYPQIVSRVAAAVTELFGFGQEVLRGK